MDPSYKVRGLYNGLTDSAISHSRRFPDRLCRITTRLRDRRSRSRTTRARSGSERERGGRRRIRAELNRHPERFGLGFEFDHRGPCR